MIKRSKQGIATLLILFSFNIFAADYLDGIAAVVEDDIILDSELVKEVKAVVTRLKANNVQLPDKKVLYQQVLERLIIDTLQNQLAKRAGIQVSDKDVLASVESIAQQNGLDLESFKAELMKEGLAFEVFKVNVRKEIMINQLRSREIGGRIKVSEQELQHYLETEMSAADLKVQYLLAHILLSVPDGASAEQIKVIRTKAQSVIDKLRAGDDFKQMAVSVSQGTNALQGGELGWQTLNKVPRLFVDTVKKLKLNSISALIRSPSGFHILKLMDQRGVETHIITETHVRHILIKTNEIVSDEDAKQRIQAISERIKDGDDFNALAKSNSDDTGSAIKGGDLGWVVPGLLVPVFEKTMRELSLNKLSKPIQTQFGWHLIQVLDRRTKDNTEEHRNNQARNALRKRKIDEETELWLRRLRDEAYVDIRLGVMNE